MIDFRECISIDNLIDIPTSNGIHTLNTRRIVFFYVEERLDRFIFKTDLITFNFSFNTTILPNSISHHFQVRLELVEQLKLTFNPFICVKMWFLDNKFLNNIELSWMKDKFQGSKMFFVGKLNLIKLIIK